MLLRSVLVMEVSVDLVIVSGTWKLKVCPTRNHHEKRRSERVRPVSNGVHRSPRSGGVQWYIYPIPSRWGIVSRAFHLPGPIITAFLFAMPGLLNLPPFPDDVPTHPLLVIDYELLTKRDEAEIEKLWKASTELGFW